VFIKLFQFPIRIYAYVVSPLLGPSCRFHPTCSAYMVQALQKHGALKGLYLGARRLLKCHPWCKCAWDDPVPKSFDWPSLISYKRSIRVQGKSVKEGKEKNA